MLSLIDSTYPVKSENCFNDFSKVFIQAHCKLSDEEVISNKSHALIIAIIGAIMGYSFIVSVTYLEKIQD